MMIGFAAGLGLYLAYLLYHSWFRVKEGHLAVVTEFGAARKKADGKHLVTVGPGLHAKRPWEHVVTVPIMEQNLDLSGQEGGSSAMTEDGTVLRLDSMLRYVPEEAELEGYLFGMKNPSDHITGLFTCLLRNEIANFRAGADSPAALAPSGAAFDFGAHAGSYALIRRERGLLNSRIADFCRTQIGNRYGVRFNAVDLTDILPPDELADALNAVIQAHSDAEARYFRAEGESQQRILAAERGVAIASARAAAIETEIRKLGEYLAELSAAGTLGPYVARRRAEVLSESRVVYLKEASS
jgi:regulator of protease activity HflC (stomatin/prohibitin superfamily)